MDDVDPRVGVLHRAIVALLVLGVVALLIRGASRPADPVLDPVARRPLAGFATVSAKVTLPDGRVLDWCALLADTEAAREQGLMDQRDLRGYDAMVFRFQGLTTGRFYMFHTVLPLSIAFVDGTGSVVSTASMDPCPEDDPTRCATFGAPVPYAHAVEADQGGLGRLGLVQGATVSFGGRCG